MAHSMHWSYA
uniref:Uncharacterized protein n=1 Tax=Arundo donax TaxID=35708 RepID=A0A0A9BG45_ARUDO